YHALSYYAAPKQRPKLDSLEHVDPKLLETFEKLGIPIEERHRLPGVAVDPGFDSVSLATTFREELKKHGVIFCAIAEAMREYPALDRATIKYSTIRNWYPGDEAGRGGIYNFVTKRGACRGRSSKISWTQVETGSAITWKYPGCILQGDDSIGEFYSVAVTNH